MRLKHLFIWLLGALATALVVAPAMAQTPADVLKPGTTYTVETRFTDTFGKVTDRSYALRVNTVSSQQIGATRIENGKELPVANILAESNYLLAGIQFPLPATGTSWKHDTPFKRMYQGSLSDYRYDGKATVVGEVVKTIAGQPVKTIEIKYEGYVTWSGSGAANSWPYTQTRWYSTDLGYVVDFVGIETFQGRTSKFELKVAKIDLPADAVPAAAPAPAAPVATTAAAPAEPPKQ